MKTLKIQHFPKNQGYKFCVLIKDGERKATGWGDSQDEAVFNAKNRIFKQIKKGNKSGCDRWIHRKHKI